MAENIKLITVCSHPGHAERLIKSADKFSWDLTVITTEWKGFGTKLLATNQFLLDNPAVKEFVFADAYDVIVMGTPEEFKKKVDHTIAVLISAEKGLWPPVLHPFERLYYDKPDGSKFNYPNSGLYYAKSRIFKHWIDFYPPDFETDDQFWMNMMYLKHKTDFGDEVKLNFAQHVFNSHSFIEDGEYELKDNRVWINGKTPIFVHGNGRTDLTKVYELI